MPFEVTKDLFIKARKRIKRQFLTGKKQPRVRFTGKKVGYYRFKHHICERAFRVDSLGRAYFTQ